MDNFDKNKIDQVDIDVAYFGTNLNYYFIKELLKLSLQKLLKFTRKVNKVQNPKIFTIIEHELKV
jgi:hypothetical protein